MIFKNLYWRRERKRERQIVWSQWFAWYPVRLGSFRKRPSGELSPVNTYLDSRMLVWFQKVLRRKISYNGNWIWKYKSCYKSY